MSVVTLFTHAQLASAQTLLAGWDFAGLSADATPALIPSTVGSALLDVSAFTPGSSNPERTAFAGNTLNAFAGGDATAGLALALANTSANNKSAIFSLSTLGYEDLVLSFTTRGTGTGFDTHAWSWSTDGVNYTPFTSIAANQTSTWSIETVDFSSISALENIPTAYLMLTVSGATSTSGNNRFDNIQINAVAVPEPTALALLGGFGILALIKRRRA